MIGWKFPSNNNGQKTGLNDAGIETFRGEPITSLAREINQNSLDAHHIGSGPVEVHFSLHKVPAADFPGREHFLEVLKSCKDYWKIEKCQEFFGKAIDVLSQDKISVLKISDYNTTGLTGSTQANSNWENLIKSVGASDKEEGAGGSFGIGKHAPFACTPLRTVFYSTRDINGQHAFQGVAKLVTHVNEAGETTQGTGYFGLVDKNDPVIDQSSIPELFKRTKTGTDLFVFGFDDSPGWKDKIIKSVLENFFVAIHQGDLNVLVDQIRINKSSLGELIEKAFSRDTASNCYKFYSAYTSEESEFKVKEDFEGMGRIELHILKGEHFPKRVAMVRQTGMLVFERGRFQTPMKFAGVLRATGNKINSFLRSLEPPMHNKWEIERHSDPNDAKRVTRALYKWIGECISDISQQSNEEEYDFEGMQQYLPDDNEDEPKQSDTDAHDKTVPTEVELVIRQAKRPVQVADPQASDNSDEDDANGPLPKGEQNDNDEPVIPREGHEVPGLGNESVSPGTGNPVVSRTPVKLKRVRAFCAEPTSGQYKIIFEPQTAGSGMLSLSIVGEVELQAAPVITAHMNGDVIAVDKHGAIGPIAFNPGSPSEITVFLDNKMRCALEVAAYENQ